MSEEMTITYERKLSDGNYGSEGLSYSVTLPVDDLEGAERIAERVREFVLTQLSHSEAPRVAAVAGAELTGAAGRAWAMSNAAAEARAIRGEDEEQEEMPF
jgi:hypothetical protein